MKYGNNVTLVHARKWLNGESCVNDGNVGSNSSTVAVMSDDSGVCGSSSCGGDGCSGDTRGSSFNGGNGDQSSCV